MIDYTNPYIRLQAIYSWLSSRSTEGHYTGMTLRELQTATQIPISVLRSDIFTLIHWNADIVAAYTDIPELDTAVNSIENMIYFDLDSQNSNKNFPGLESLLEDLDSGICSPELKRKILDGELDDIPIFIDHSCCSAFDIALSFDETLALNSVFKDIDSEHHNIHQNSNFLQIKDSYRTIHNYRELADRLQSIEEAIEYRTPLFMVYKDAKNAISQFHFQPLKVSYDETENLYCVLSIYRGKIQVRRLDRIIKLEASTEKVESGDVSIIEELAPQVWGNCFSEEPQHVKVKFYNEANVWSKVRRDLACRTKGQLYEKDGFLYYEDTVYGISKFRPWIYSFGSSAIVLEPRSLREHIINSLRERKDRDQI